MTRGRQTSYNGASLKSEIKEYVLRRKVSARVLNCSELLEDGEIMQALTRGQNYLMTRKLK